MALVVIAALVLVVIALVVVSAVVTRRSDRSGPVAEVSGAATTAQPGPQSVLDVDAPAPPSAADAPCTSLMQSLPTQLEGTPLREVRSASPYVRAWGDPPVVLVCGVDRPAGLTAGAQIIDINGVNWLVDSSAKDTVVWTAVDRPVYVQVRVPASADSSSVTELTRPISAALPAAPSSPGG